MRRRPQPNVESLFADLRYAVRKELERPIFAVAAILSLALGIGANTTIFSLINTLFLKPLPVEAPEELVAVYTQDDRNPGFNPVSHLNYLDFRDGNEVFSELAIWQFLPFNLTGGDEPVQVVGQMVSGNYFDTLGVRAAVGRTFLAEEDATPGTHPVVVLGHGLWERRFGADHDLVGRTIRLNGQSFTVIGVAPPEFTGAQLGMAPALWVPSMMHPQLLTGNLGGWFDNRRALLFNVVGRLKPGTSLEQAEANLKTLAARLEREYPDANRGRGVQLVPLVEAVVPPGPQARGGATLALGLLMAIVLVVLLIACANVANLLLARAAVRRREIAVRIALGAARGRLVRQLLTESLLVALMGGAAGLGLAIWAGRLLLAAQPPLAVPLHLDLSLDARILAFTLTVALATGLLFGLAPALQASRPGVVAELKGDSRGGSPGSPFSGRNLLVVAQVALSLIALIGAGLLTRSLGAAQGIDPGFDADRLAVLTFNAGAQGYDQSQSEELYRRLLDGVAGLPGVASAALGETLPLAIGGTLRSVFLEGQEEGGGEGGILTRVDAVTPGYFTTLGIPRLQGRDFDSADRPDNRQVVIVNETMARTFWPREDPIGKRFRFHGDEEPRHIVGVVADSKYGNLQEEPQTAVYYPLTQNYSGFVTLFVRTSSNPEPLLGALQGEVRRLDPNLPVPILDTMPRILDRSLWVSRMGAVLLGIFGLLALILASVGLLGVMSYSVAQRRREIGIRLAMGAGRGDVLGMILRRGLSLVAAGLLAGFLIALPATHLITSLLYGVSPTDAVTFAAAALVLTVVALLASLLPARRAMAVDPLIALRSE